jgi:hypothetical protein
MVMTLPLPTVDSVQLASDVVAERANGVNAAFFNGIQQEWCLRIQQYIDAAGSPPAYIITTALVKNISITHQHQVIIHCIMADF